MKQESCVITRSERAHECQIHRVNYALVKLFIVLAIPAVIILRSLWVNFPPPQGLKLQCQQVPYLFNLIDGLATALKAPKFHHILLTPDFNAAVIQVPRLGIFGWQQNYLIIGLPLLQSLSPEQFRAVLAHELGHLSGNHSRFAGWIYRVRKTWGQILQRFEESEQPGTEVLFKRFLDWYVPFLNAYSFVLARADEYEADRCSAQLAGSQYTAAALVQVNVKSQFIEQSFWTGIYQQADCLPNPPATPFTSLAKALQAQTAPKQHQWLGQSLSAKTNLADTHPCLTERLTALGIAVENAASLLTPIQQTAAEYFLGNALTPLTRQLNQEWQTAVTFQWHERYTYIQNIRQQLQTLNNKASDRDLTLEEAWHQAKCTAELREEQAAIPLLKLLLDRQKEHVSANYLLGQILIEQKDETGIDYLETAMAKDPEVVLLGCQLIYAFLQQQGRESEAESYHQRAQQHDELLLLAQQERAVVSDRDQFKPHGLSVPEVQQIRQQLIRYSEILKEAYLVQKVVRYIPERPFYILGVKRKRAWFELGFQFDNSKDRQLIDSLVRELPCPGQTWIVLLNQANKPLVIAIQKAAKKTIAP